MQIEDVTIENILMGVLIRMNAKKSSWLVIFDIFVDIYLPKVFASWNSFWNYDIDRWQLYILLYLSVIELEVTPDNVPEWKVTLSEIVLHLWQLSFNNCTNYYGKGAFVKYHVMIPTYLPHRFRLSQLAKSQIANRQLANADKREDSVGQCNSSPIFTTGVHSSPM